MDKWDKERQQLQQAYNLEELSKQFGSNRTKRADPKLERLLEAAKSLETATLRGHEHVAAGKKSPTRKPQDVWEIRFDRSNNPNSNMVVQTLSRPFFQPKEASSLISLNSAGQQKQCKSNSSETKLKALEHLLEIQEASILGVSAMTSASSCADLKKLKFQTLLARWRKKVFELMMREQLLLDMHQSEKSKYVKQIDLLQQRIADLESENLVSRQKHQIFSSELAHYKSVSKSLDKINGELGECAVSYHNSLHTHQESLQNVRVVMEGFHSGFEKKIANVKADIFRRLRETENHLLAASDRIHILETILKTNNSAQESSMWRTMVQDRDRVIDSLRVRLERMDQLLREAKTQSQVQRIQNLTLPSDQNLSEQSRTELSEQRITVDRTMKRLETLQTLSKNLLLDDE